MVSWLDRFLTRLRGEPARSRRREATPFRVPDGLRVYAIGDVHGHADLLDRMAELVADDLRRDPPREARAVFVGDYIDRGPDTAGVIERLVTRRFPVPFETLRGNHEDLMMRALDAPEPSVADAMEDWCGNGGLETIRSYGVEVEKARHGKGLRKLRTEFLRSFPEAHRAFLDATALSLRIGGYFFAHAGARPEVPLDRQDPEDLMWIRDACYGSDFDFGVVLVHGHTPHKRPEDLPRRINVDTGAFKWGVLSAAVLEGGTRRFLSTRD
ncbi:MAG: serine/threonine protein phosphatase [Parafilimonas terrae]|nr:serine/threonine protein phosphatase [Parafilimonas terrae]